MNIHFGASSIQRTPLRFGIRPFDLDEGERFRNTNTKYEPTEFELEIQKREQKYINRQNRAFLKELKTGNLKILGFSSSGRESLIKINRKKYYFSVDNNNNFKLESAKLHRPFFGIPGNFGFWINRTFCHRNSTAFCTSAFNLPNKEFIFQSDYSGNHIYHWNNNKSLDGPDHSWSTDDVEVTKEALEILTDLKKEVFDKRNLG